MSNSEIPNTYDFLQGFDIYCDSWDFLGGSPVKLRITLGTLNPAAPAGLNSSTPLLKEEFLAALWSFYTTLASHVDDAGTDFQLGPPRIFLSNAAIETEDPTV